MFELNGASRSDPPPGFLRLGVWIEVGRRPVTMFLCVFDRRVSFGDDALWLRPMTLKTPAVNVLRALIVCVA